MGSHGSYRSWRQKGVAAAITGVLALPFVDGYVKEQMPGGLLAHLKEQRSIEQTRDMPVHTPPLISEAEASRERPTLESLLEHSDLPSGDLSLDLAYKTATSLAHLTREDIEGYERAGALMGIDPVWLTMISILESDGAQNMSPRAYGDSEGDRVPFGHHHVKPRDLASVLDQASEARTYFEDLLGERWSSVRESGWSAINDYERLLDPEERERAEAAFMGRSGALRMFALSTIVPEDIEDLDHEDAEQSGIAAGVMNAYAAAYLASHDLPITSESLLLTFTAGQAKARSALRDASSDVSLSDTVRDSVGPHSAWYVESGPVLLDHLSSYGSLREAHEHASRIADLVAQAPEANEETIGLLYMMSQKNPQLYDAIAFQLLPTENGRRDVNDLVAAYADR